jgi:hypothetical protein
MGSHRLGIDTNLALALRDYFKLKWFIETGTYKAGTATWAADHFERVITIEAWEKRYNGLIEQFRDQFPNLTFVLGDSRVQLERELAQVHEPALLFLDAHWIGNSVIAHEQKDECPLREELVAINAHPYAAAHCILIDDARLFTAPPPYPHHPAQWPDIDEVMALLAAHPRIVTIYEDVIYGLPITVGEWFWKQIGVS